MTDLCFETATSLAALIRSRAVSCVEVLDAHLARIEALNPRLNAIVSLVPDRARERAAALDAEFPVDVPLLYGLPIAHKDLVSTRGLRTTFGSPLFAEHVPDKDDLIVERLRAAGTVCLGKTNTPEFGAGSQTFNPVFGATRNPYDPTRTCGGSSGGAAVALASRMLPIADGSDLGGSLRNPAAFCNVVGLRPAPGRVPGYPARSPWFDMPVKGPMARTVDDVALMLAAMVGDDPRVPLALTDPGDHFYPLVPIAPKGLRIALAPDLGGVPVEREIRETIEAMGARIAGLGCEVELACPDLTDATDIFHVQRANWYRERFGGLPPAQRAKLKDTIEWNLSAGEALTLADLDRTSAQRAALFDRVAEFFTRFDFLVCPTTQVLPFPVEQPYPTSIEGTPMHDYLEWMQSCAQLTVAGCPSISIPGGFSANGLPIGLQIASPQRTEAKLLAFAKVIEADTRYGERLPPC